MKDALTSLLNSVRRKLQMERLIYGLALVFLAFLLLSIVSSYLLAQRNFADEALFWTRLVGGMLLLAIVLKLVLGPMVRPPSRRKVARFMEERHPELEDRLSTAVELAEGPSRVHPEIRALVQRDARGRLTALPRPRFFKPQVTLSALLVLGASLLVFSILMVSGPGAYRYSLDKLFAGWYDEAIPPLYSIEVQPGDTRVGKRADLEIRARLQGFNSDRVRLVARYENQPQWEEVPMRADLTSDEFVFLFFDIRDPIDYYVEADGIRSDTYTVLVSEIPRVEKLRLSLNFPRYTGLSSVVQEDSGDIRALVGTEVEFSVWTDQPIQAGKIRLEEEGEIPLERVGPNELTGVLKVARNDYYRIHFRDQEGFWNPGSDEFLIDARQDLAPTLSFRRPGRDQKVTNLEEVYTEIQAEDDHGIARVLLHYSVNGEPVEQVPLSIPRGSTSFTTSYTFYLEELGLVPGDFVSYYAQAWDARTSAKTDIYFLEVEPYDREYYQSQQGGGMDGAGDGEELILSRRQKEIIAATFNLVRERENFSKSGFEESSQTLALVQQRLQNEAQTIVERIQRRGPAARDPRFQTMSESLSRAIQHMEPAYINLNQLKPQEALPDEQKALQQLLRAEALFKEIQVAFAQDQGSPGSPSAQDLADLVDLELDKTKNQYETLQQNRRMNQERELDEALEKLKELARRQQQEAERRRQAAASSTGGAPQSQDQLIEEAERLARQLERLSREQQDQRLQDLSRQLQQAARDMRQAQAAGQDSPEAQAQAQRAAERLQQAQGALDQQRQDDVRQRLQSLREESDRLAERQKEVVDRVDQLKEQAESGQVDPRFIQQTRQLLREKSDLQSDLQRLEADLHHSARQIEGKEPEASRKLKQAGIDIRDQGIPEKIQEGAQFISRGWMDLAQNRERGIQGHLEDLADKIQDAERALGSPQQPNAQERLRQALDQVGKLVDDLESMSQRATGPSERSEGPEGPPSEGSPSEEGAPSEGSPSEQGAPSEGAPQGSQQASASGEQPGGAPGQTGAETQPTPGSTMGGGSFSGTADNRLGGINPQQIGREWRERLEDAQAIRQLLTDRPDLLRDFQSLERELRRLDAQRVFADPAGLARLRAEVIEGLRQLELEINRALEPDPAGRLRLVNEDEVPPEFRDRVEDYYRALAGQRKR